MKQRSTVITLIAVICAFFIFQLLNPEVVNFLSLQPFDYLRFSNEWYRMFTVALLHDTSNSIPYHLAFNMILLHQFGAPLEQTFGRINFLIIFFVSLLSGSIASSLFLETASIGASGAVFGLFGAVIAAGRRAGYEVKSAIVILAINLVLGFTIGGVDWRAHLGGLLGGFVITKTLLLLNAPK